MNTYQSGALTEASCALIAKALQAYVASDACAPDEAEDAQALAAEFANPAVHFIQLDTAEG